MAWATIIAGIISAATAVAGGVMSTSATAEAGAKAESLEEQRMETEEERYGEGMRLKRAEMGMQQKAQDNANQQWWTSRADGLKQLGKQQFDKFANGMLNKANNSIMAKQAIQSLW